jgi:hypothetical protein
MASVPAKEQTRAARDRGLLPSVRPITTLLATGIVWITVLLSVCGFAAGYLRQQALNTTAGELTRLDTVLGEAASRSSQGLDAMVASLAAMFKEVPLADDTTIALLGADGRVLAGYPEQRGRADSARRTQIFGLFLPRAALQRCARPARINGSGGLKRYGRSPAIRSPSPSAAARRRRWPTGSVR